MRKYDQSKFMTGFVKLTGAPAALLLYKTKCYYESDKSPRKLMKPSLLVINHVALLDMPAVWIRFFTTNIRFLVGEVMFNKGALMSWFLYKIGSVKVDRTGFDFGFMCEAIDILDEGGVVGIFPQGRLPVNGKPFPFKPSVSFIALHSDAPIVPVYIDGQYKLTKRTHMVIGDPIYLKDLRPENMTDVEAMDYLTQYLEKKVYSLKEYIK